MKEERKKVLEMLVEGTISVEEADVLLDILQEPGKEKAVISGKTEGRAEKNQRKHQEG